MAAKRTNHKELYSQKVCGSLFNIYQSCLEDNYFMPESCDVSRMRYDRCVEVALLWWKSRGYA